MVAGSRKLQINVIVKEVKQSPNNIKAHGFPLSRERQINRWCVIPERFNRESTNRLSVSPSNPTAVTP